MRLGPEGDTTAIEIEQRGRRSFCPDSARHASSASEASPPDASFAIISLRVPHPSLTTSTVQARTRALALALALAAVACVEPPERPPPEPTASPFSSGTELAPPPAMIAARGPDRVLPPRPQARQRGCSPRRPVCVHGEGSSSQLARTLGVAERALDGLAALLLPPPRQDFASGGGPELDIYLVGGTERARAIVDLDHVDASWDLAAAFVVAPPPRARGCQEDAQLAAAVADASVLGRDAGVERAMGAAVASHLASLIAPCDAEETAAVDELQRSPERGLEGDPADPSSARGGRLFLSWMEERYGSGRPGELAMALVAAAPQRTPVASLQFRNEPDVVDILRANARAGGSPAYGELLRDFAVARAFVGSRSDGAHITDVARHGELGRVRFDWAVTWASLPRNLAPARPLLPTGASYVWVDLKDAPGGVSMTMVAAWEPPVSFRWAIVKIGANGEEKGRLEPPTQLGATSIQQSLPDLNGLAGLVVVGVNEGGSSAIDAHDPDDGPFGAQGYTLTLYPE